MKYFPNVSKIFLLVVIILIVMNYTANCYAQSYETINDSVVLYYNFDQNAFGELSANSVPYHKKIIDNSGNSCYAYAAGGGAYNLTHVPNVYWDTFTDEGPLWEVVNDNAKIDFSLYFDGTDYLTVENQKTHEIGWSDYSVIFWFKADTDGGLFYQDKDGTTGLKIAWDTSRSVVYAGLFYNSLSNYTYVSDTSIAFDTWYLLSFRLDRDGNARLDITSESGTVGDTGSTEDDISNIIYKINNSNYGVIGWQYTGFIDEFGLYSDYVTDAEIEWLAAQDGSEVNMHNNAKDNGLYNPEIGESGIDCIYCEDDDVILDYYGLSVAYRFSSPSEFQDMPEIDYKLTTFFVSGELVSYMYPIDGSFSGNANFDGRASGDWNYYTTWQTHDSLGEYLLAIESQNYNGHGGQGFTDLGFGFISHSGLVGNHPTHFHTYLDRVIMNILDNVLFPEGTEGHIEKYWESGNSYGSVVFANSMLFNNDKLHGGIASACVGFNHYLDQKAWWLEYMHDVYCSSVTNLGWRYGTEDLNTNFEIYKLHNGRDSGTWPVTSILDGNGTMGNEDLYYKACPFTNAGNYKAPCILIGGNEDYRMLGDIWGPPNHSPVVFPSDLILPKIEMLGQHGGSAECGRYLYSGPEPGKSWIEYITEYDAIGVPEPPESFGSTSGSGYPMDKVNWDNVNLTDVMWDDFFKMDSNSASYDEESGSYCDLKYRDGWGCSGRFGGGVVITTKAGVYGGYPFAIVGTDGGELNILRYNPTGYDPDGGADDNIEGWYIVDRSIDDHKLNYGVWGLKFTEDQDYLLAGDATGKLHWYTCTSSNPALWAYTAFTDYQYEGGGADSGLDEFGREITSMICSGDLDSNGYDEFWFKNWYGTVFCVEVQGEVLVTRFAQVIAPWVSLFDVGTLDGTDTLAIGTILGDFRLYTIDTSSDIFTILETGRKDLQIAPCNVTISENGSRVFAITRNTEFYDPAYPQNDSADLYNAGEEEAGNGHQLLYAFDSSCNILDRIKLYPNAGGYDYSSGSRDRSSGFPDTQDSDIRSFDIYYDSGNTMDFILLSSVPPRIIKYDSSNGFVRSWINKTMDYVDYTYDLNQTWEGDWEGNGIDIPQPYYDETETTIGDTNWLDSNIILACKIFDLEGSSDKEFVALTLGGWWHTFEHDWDAAEITSSSNLPQLIKESWSYHGMTNTFEHDGGPLYVNTARTYAVALANISRIGGLNQYSPMKARTNGGFGSTGWCLLRATNNSGTMVFESGDIDGAIMSQESSKCVLTHSGGMGSYATETDPAYFTVDEQLIKYTSAVLNVLGSGIYKSTKEGGVCQCGDNTYYRWGQIYVINNPTAETEPGGVSFDLPTNHTKWFSGPVVSNSGIPQKWQQLSVGELYTYAGKYQMDYPETDNFLTSYYHDAQGTEYGTVATVDIDNPEIAIANLGGVVGVIKPSYLTVLDSYDQFSGGIDRRGDEDDDWESGQDDIPDIAGTSSDGEIVLTNDYIQDGFLWYKDLGHYCQGLDVGDVDGDGVNEIVVGVMMGDYSVADGTGAVSVDTGRRGYVYVLEVNASGASVSYPFSSTYSVGPIWELNASEYIPTGPSSLRIANVDGTGNNEIIVGSVDGRMYILSYDSADHDLDIEYRSTKYGMFAGVHNQIYTNDLLYGDGNLEIWIGGSDGVRCFSTQ